VNEHDLIVRNGTLVDGTGIPKYQTDVAVKNGRVSLISGRIRAQATKEIDASGCIIAPGAIDMHTHYDGQLNWDPYCSLSGWFGVTSLSIGQCGFGFAPTRPEDRELSMAMMNRVEAIPLESMRLGIRWDWETFPEYLDSLDSQGLGVNVAALFPFAALRGYVLGMREARERTSVTDKELNQMKQLFRDGMAAGAYGFASSMNTSDRAEDGGWLPGHKASDAEYLALADVLGTFGIGHIGWTIGRPGGLPPERSPKNQRHLLDRLMDISGRPLHVDVDGNGFDDPWVAQSRLEGRPLLTQELAEQAVTYFTLAEYNAFDYMPNWVQPLVGAPTERAAKLQNPDTRKGMKADCEAIRQAHRPEAMRTDWNNVIVTRVVREKNEKFEGLTVSQIAHLQNKDGLDAFLDLALDEDLLTEFSHPVDAGGTAEHVTFPYGHVSNSDGGAHVRFLVASTWPVDFLTKWVRDREIVTLEAAHHKMSALPAWLGGLQNRGTLRVGTWADMMIYNLAELGLLYDRPIFANDFPGGERRLIQKPTGMRYILVNGTVTFKDNICTQELPGKLLRSYDTLNYH